MVVNIFVSLSIVDVRPKTMKRCESGTVNPVRLQEIGFKERHVY